MRNLLSQFRHKVDLHESQGEIILGEVVRAMARLGYPSVSFRLQGEGQLVQFRTVGHPALYAVHVLIDRSARSPTARATGASLRITAEARSRSTQAADLLRLATSHAHTEPARAFAGDIRVERELGSVLAHTHRTLDLDDHVSRGEAGARALVALLRTTLETLSDAISRHESALA